MVSDAPRVGGFQRIRRGWLSTALIGVIVAAPAISVQASGWSERLEPVPWLAGGGLACALILASLRTRWQLSHLLGALSGLIITTLLYASSLPQPEAWDRVVAFATRVASWLQAASSGAPSTDNLLFAYSMGLLAWLIGYLGGFGAMRALNPWWAIVPSGAALLLNLSYSPPEMLPLVFVHLLASIGLLIQSTTLMRSERWQTEVVAERLSPGRGYALSGVGVGLLILFVAWRIPAGDVHKGVASAWENVSGPWQQVQTHFDRLFAALNPSSLPGKGLTVAQTMAPRGSFELGDNPVLRISGREPGYWRAVTYDQYTGRAMTSSQTTSQRLERREPLEGSMDTEGSRKFSEFTVTLLAPSTSVIYAPDEPLTVSIPTVYDFRNGDRHDYGSLRPLAPIHEQQRYSVLASVSTASAADLRQTSTTYPYWTNSYLQLPPQLPDRLRAESRRVIGDASNSYDAAINVQQYLRGLSYSTRVPVPPADRDWVSFLVFQSKEGYCDYFATAMAVMLRTLGIPSRVASGYVTGDWDASTQSYVATEHHAHSWTEVYFPGYGWITFEPSANRPAPVRPETSPTLSFSDETITASSFDSSFPDFYDDEEDFGSSGPLTLPQGQSGPNPVLIFGLLALMLLLVSGGVTGLIVFWRRGIRGLPVVARPFAQLVRLATWCGIGPRPSQTPYEYGHDLQRMIPAAGDRIGTLMEAYVAGLYGGKQPESARVDTLVSLGHETRRLLIQTLAMGRWRTWISGRLSGLAGIADRRAP